MLTPLKVVLKELATKGVHGALITGTYLGFNEPAVFRELMKISNLDVRIVTALGFHAKGYFLIMMNIKRHILEVRILRAVR